MSCYVKDAKKKNPNSQLVLLGDNIGASPFTSGSQDDNPTIKALNSDGRVCLRSATTNLTRARKSSKRASPAAQSTASLTRRWPSRTWAPTSKAHPASVSTRSGHRLGREGCLHRRDRRRRRHPGFPWHLRWNEVRKPVPVINNLAKSLKEKGEADVVIAMYDNDVERSYPKMGINGRHHGRRHLQAVLLHQGKDRRRTRAFRATASGSFTDNLSNLQIKFDKKTRKAVDSAAIQIKRSRRRQVWRRPRG